MLFIRHADVVIDESVDSTAWRLSENGHSQTHQLAPQLVHLNIDRILTSHEPKAVQTGAALAEIWGVPAQIFPNLHEHERGSGGFVGNREAWLEMVAQFLTRPDELVFGEETAVQAAMRMKTAVRTAEQTFPNEQLAFVTHGRILTAFLSAHNPDLDAITYWQTLTLPAAIIVDHNNFTISQTLTMA